MEKKVKKEQIKPGQKPGIVTEEFKQECFNKLDIVFDCAEEPANIICPPICYYSVYKDKMSLEELTIVKKLLQDEILEIQRAMNKHHTEALSKLFQETKANIHNDIKAFKQDVSDILDDEEYSPDEYQDWK
jgi:hypothetical protein